MNYKFAAHERRLLHCLEELRKRRVRLRCRLRNVTCEMRVEFEKLPDGVKKKLSRCMFP